MHQGSLKSEQQMAITIPNFGGPGVLTHSVQIVERKSGQVFILDP